MDLEHDESILTVRKGLIKNRQTICISCHRMLQTLWAVSQQIDETHAQFEKGPIFCTLLFAAEKNVVAETSVCNEYSHRNHCMLTHCQT